MRICWKISFSKNVKCPNSLTSGTHKFVSSYWLHSCTSIGSARTEPNSTIICSIFGVLFGHVTHFPNARLTTSFNSSSKKQIVKIFNKSAISEPVCEPSKNLSKPWQKMKTTSPNHATTHLPWRSTKRAPKRESNLLYLTAERSLYSLGKSLGNSLHRYYLPKRTLVTNPTKSIDLC